MGRVSRNTNLEELEKEYSWAIGKILEYRYREKFSLSYEDFANEPLSSYIINSSIISIIEDINKREVDKLKRKQKHGK